jgi:transposase
MVLTRLKTDFVGVRRGEVQLAEFKQQIVPYRHSEILLRDDGSIELTTFAGRKNNRVRVVPVNPDKSSRATLERIRTGQYKKGSAVLKWHRPPGRKGRWFLSLMYTDVDHTVTEVVPEEVADPSQVIVAGIDTGIRHALWIRFTTLDGKPVRKPEIVPFPKRLLRAVERINTERRERSTFNRAALEVRSGRGKQRKLRATKQIGDKVARLVDTMIQQVVAEGIARCVRRGASVIVLEDHGKWAVEGLHDYASWLRWSGGTNHEAARHRRRLFTRHEGAIRAQLQWVAKREGLQTLLVDPAWTSRTCHQCGVLHKRDWHKRQAREDEVPAGRVALEKFYCNPEGTEPVFRIEDGKIVPIEQPGCGYAGQADDNAAINIARRGIDQLNDPDKWKLNGNKRSSLVGQRVKRKRPKGRRRVVEVAAK